MGKENCARSVRLQRSVRLGRLGAQQARLLCGRQRALLVPAAQPVVLLQLLRRALVPRPAPETPQGFARLGSPFPHAACTRSC